MQDLRHGDQERGMRRLQQAIRKMHLQEEIGESQKALTSGNKIDTVKEENMNIERRFKMKRFSAMVVVLGMVAALAGLALAAEKEKTPDATLTLSEGQVAVGIGWSWGKGVLTFEGEKPPIQSRRALRTRRGNHEGRGGGHGL